MRLHQTLFFLFVFAAISVWAAEEEEDDEETESTDVSHGLGTDVDWVEWSKAFKVQEEQQKPIFLLVHKSWCGACKRLKESFQTSPKRNEFVKLAKKFVMVNTEDDEEPEDEKYAPDGRYIPRLYFLDNEGDPLPIDNKKNYPRNAYYFPQLVDVVKAMKKALKLYAEPVDGEEQDQTTTESKTEPKEDKKEKDQSKKNTEETKNKKSESEKKAEDKKTKKTKEDKKEKKEGDKENKKENSNKKSEKTEQKAKAEKKEEGEKKNSKNEKKEKKSEDKKTKTDKEEKSTKTDKKSNKDAKKESKKKSEDKKTEL